MNYLRNLLSCYQQYPDPDIQLHLFIDYPEDAMEYQGDAIVIHRMEIAIPAGLQHYPRRIMKRLLGYDPQALNVLKQAKIDLLTHNPLGKQDTIDTLYWQPDFQHRLLPDLFSPEERAGRDAIVETTRRWGKILLSSHAAAKDFRDCYPDLAAVQTHVLHFSSTGILGVVPMERTELAKQYPVSEPYFFLPNQFWKHKNHQLVVDALRQANSDIRVICTGRMEDYRDPAYVPNLLEQVKRAGLEDQFITLGSVPYPVLASLMHHSVAVLQPSLFEGWSTSVEESKAMRKSIVLSNLAVHLEQAPERGTFFSPNSPDDLAAKLEQVYSEFDPVIEETYAAKRLLNRSNLEHAWATNFSNIIKTVRKAGHEQRSS
ncbi:MAG: glycosyltransferase [Janthinobacterium lividum]